MTTAAEFLQAVLDLPPERWPDRAHIVAALDHLGREHGAECRASWTDALNAALVKGATNAPTSQQPPAAGSDARGAACGDLRLSAGRRLGGDDGGVAFVGAAPASAGDPATPAVVPIFGTGPRIDPAAGIAHVAPGGLPADTSTPAGPGATIGSPSRPWAPGDPVPGVGAHQPPPPVAPGIVAEAPRRGVADDWSPWEGIAAVRDRTALGPHEVMHGSGLKMIEAGERLLAQDAGTYSKEATALILMGNKLLKEAAPFMVSKKIEVAGAGGQTQSHEDRLRETMEALRSMHQGDPTVDAAVAWATMRRS